MQPKTCSRRSQVRIPFLFSVDPRCIVRSHLSAYDSSFLIARVSGGGDENGVRRECSQSVRGKLLYDLFHSDGVVRPNLLSRDRLPEAAHIVYAEVESSAFIPIPSPSSALESRRPVPSPSSVVEPRRSESRASRNSDIPDSKRVKFEEMGAQLLQQQRYDVLSIACVRCASDSRYTCRDFQQAILSSRSPAAVDSSVETRLSQLEEQTQEMGRDVKKILSLISVLAPPS